MLTEPNKNKNRTSMVQGPRGQGSTASFDTLGSTPCQRVKGASKFDSWTPQPWYVAQERYGELFPLKRTQCTPQRVENNQKDEESFEERSTQTTTSVKTVLGDLETLVPQVIMY